MISETRERFLRAIVAKVPAEQIVEIHFFQPIKQGGVESGVAVIAADPEAAATTPSVPLPDADAAPSSEPAPHAAPPGAEIAGGSDEGYDATAAAPHDSGDERAAPGGASYASGAAQDEEQVEADDVVAADEAVDEIESESPGEGAVAAHQPRPHSSLSDDIPTESALDDLVSGEDWGDDDVEEPAVDEPRAPRFTVYTARYRLVLKGIDRGKWESAVVDEADAPLLTVETVVRGVQRRSGDAEDATRMSGAEVRAELERMSAAAAVKASVALGGARL